MSHMNAQIVRLYDTVFDRAPDTEGLEFWNGATHQGLGLRDLANFFIAAPEFASTYGEPTNLGFVQSLYQNILDRAGEAEGIAFWTNALDSGLADRPQVVVGFSESAEHIQQMAAANEPITYENAPRYNTIIGTEENDELRGTEGRDGIFGRGGSDKLHGGEGDDLLKGEAGNDTLDGGPGDDLLDGGAGADWMVGGAGRDTYIFNTAQEVNGDGIYFGEGDLLNFRSLNLVFRGPGAFEATGQAQLRYDEQFIYRDGYPYSSRTDIHIDANGDGVGDASMMLTLAGIGSAAFLI